MSTRELDKELVNIFCELVVRITTGSEDWYGAETFDTISLVTSSLVFGLGRDMCGGLLLSRVAFVGGELVIPEREDSIIFRCGSVIGGKSAFVKG